MNRMPGEVNFVSKFLIVMGTFFGITLVLFTLLGGLATLKWLIILIPFFIFLVSALIAGIGMRRGKRWAWLTAQIACLFFSSVIANFVITDFFTNDNSAIYKGFPLLVIISTVSFLLFNKDSMLYFKLEESKRVEYIIITLFIFVIICFGLLTKNILFR